MLRRVEVPGGGISRAACQRIMTARVVSSNLPLALVSNPVGSAAAARRGAFACRGRSGPRFPGLLRRSGPPDRRMPARSRAVVLGPAVAASALTRIPRTDNARIKARMACSPLILKSLNDFEFPCLVTIIPIDCSMGRDDCCTALLQTMPVTPLQPRRPSAYSTDTHKYVFGYCAIGGVAIIRTGR